MSSDDPFASFDGERTFIMPSPGQRAARASSPADGVPAVAVEDLIPGRGLNPLVAAASPLLNAVPQLRASTTHADPAGLRETLVRGIRAFETRATREGVLPSHVLAASYTLCTFIDEMIAGTPWGSAVWGKFSLLVTIHGETWGGEKVFQLLAKLAQKPAENRDLLELMYVVLALGFEGRYRVLDNGRSQLEQLRERLLAMIEKERGPYERELSGRWKGLAIKRPMLLQLPMWAVLAVLGLVAVGLYLGLSARLNSLSDPVFADIQGIRIKGPMPPPQPQLPAPKPRLAAFLAPEIKAGQVAVADFGDRSVVTIRGDGLFEPGGTAVTPDVLPLLARIAEALAAIPGNVLVTGHTDNQPIRSARFPSNWHLSQERAEAVQALLAATVDPTRITAEGRADSQPIGGNATPAERARNRRVEITLFIAKPAT